MVSNFKRIPISAMLFVLTLAANNVFGGNLMLNSNGFPDDVQIDTLWTEDFESGWNGWYADNGVWEVGEPGPDYGPSTPHSGTNCAGTVLNGNYPTNTSSRLISPAFVVPPADQNPRVRFFMWHLLYRDGYDDDYGYLQVKVNHPDSTWHTLGQFHGYSAVWSQSMGELAAYSGSEVRIGFLLVSDDRDVHHGIYIDDIQLVTGDYDFANGGFENGWGDWYTTNGVWEVGEPGPDYGPDSSYTGINCAGTILNGNYSSWTSSRLVSPPFTVPSADLKPRIRFFMWQFLYRDGYDDDYGYFQIKVNHPDSSWQSIRQMHGYSHVWSQSGADLTDYEGLEIRIAFQLVADDRDVHQGWYIDDVQMGIGDYDFAYGGFENGWGDWCTSNGVWETGSPGPDYGPDSSFAGSSCIGTILNGHYNSWTSSRLISPPFEVRNQNPMMFAESWHRLYVDGYDDDFGYIQIKVEHPDSNWNSLDTLSGYSPVWSHIGMDLSPWRGQIVRVCFQIVADDRDTDDGWYIDEIDLPMVTSGSFELSYNPDDFIFNIPADTIVMRTFDLISHNASGYVNSNCYANWAYITPDSVNLGPGDTVTVTAYFNSANLDYRTYFTNITFESDVSGLESAVIPVEMTVYTALDVTVDIPDGNLYPGDTLAANITVENPTDGVVSAYFATGMQLPNDEYFGPVFGPIYISMLPEGMLSGTIKHVVPGYAPPGSYSYIAGVYNSVMILGTGEDNFSILSNDPMGNQALESGGWEVIYSDFEDMEPYASGHDGQSLPTEVSCGNYPNPFNAATVIEYAIPEASNVSVEIYNLMGQKVETLVDGYEQAGYKSCTWDASQYSSGIYFYKLTAGNEVITKRMTVVK